MLDTFPLLTVPVFKVGSWFPGIIYRRPTSFVFLRKYHYELIDFLTFDRCEPIAVIIFIDALYYPILD